MNFDDSFAKLIGNEGGLVNNPADPGGQTKYGISKRSYPGEDIPSLTLERAKYLYQRDFWGPAGCDALPDALKFEMFDAAVNMGLRPAVKLLQLACGSFADGVLGPNTLQAVQSMEPAKTLRRLQAQRLRYYAGMVSWPAFGKGWVNRVANNMLEV
jgi:lysozyme family protein